MRIGTWNLGNKALTAARRDLLLKQRCDVWLLTEINPQWLKPKGRIAGFHYHHTQGVMACGQHYAAILSVQPLSPLPDPHPGTAAAMINGITYWSTVLPWREEGHDQGAKTVADIQTLLKVPLESDLVWGGDWNHSLIGQDWVGTKVGRTHLLAALKKLKLQLPTAGLPSQSGNGQYSIDHIAVPWAWTVGCACHIPTTLSDHDAYVIEIP